MTSVWWRQVQSTLGKPGNGGLVVMVSFNLCIFSGLILMFLDPDKLAIVPPNAEIAGPPNGDDFDCPSDGLFPDPSSDCRTFFYCQGQQVFLKQIFNNT